MVELTLKKCLIILYAWDVSQAYIFVSMDIILHFGDIYVHNVGCWMKDIFSKMKNKCVIISELFKIYTYSRRSAIFKKGSWKRVPNNNQIVFMYYI